ncbi:hypothetical protein CALCODRAFT_337731 [Calocera cornea HHB12733]|uniref:Uncharacterized protein n=1 Tax=Calocera cornea HHB12733 TaxID=1353952 RepID=A0A165EZF9_9BASI|nr:hypothetical protein CALCODRAFT_337731 [Calocera cornea HHB12733]
MTQERQEQRGPTQSSTTAAVPTRSVSDSAVNLVHQSAGDTNMDEQSVREDDDTSDDSAPSPPGKEHEPHLTRGRNNSGAKAIHDRSPIGANEWGHGATTRRTYQPPFLAPLPQPRGAVHGPGPTPPFPQPGRQIPAIHLGQHQRPRRGKRRAGCII